MLANDFMRSSDLAFWKYEKHPVTNTTTASTTPRYRFSGSYEGRGGQGRGSRGERSGEKGRADDVRHQRLYSFGKHGR